MGLKYSRRVATNMVVANMIGTGIFTSVGFQVAEGAIPDGFAIMTIWLLGGLIALCGATVYGEIATTIGKSGGEYAFLSTLYHPILGFVSGWVSIVVGFSAAIASLAIAAGEYFMPALSSAGDSAAGQELFGLPMAKVIAVLIILGVAMIQLRGIKAGGIFQNFMTYFKLALILLFVALPLICQGWYTPSGLHFTPDNDSLDTIFSVSFAGSLVWVMFAYSGWNASVYIVGSLENPKKNLPYSLIAGTLIVSAIYLLLNYVFLYVASFDELAFQIDVGNVVVQKILGEKIGLLFTLVFSVALISGISAMFIAGPRVAQEIGKDYPLFKKLGKQAENGAPKLAIVVILLISMVLVFALNFQDLIEFIGVTLSIFSLLTVLGVFILRYKKLGNENTVKSWAYPLTPVIFASFSLWMISYFVQMKPIVLLWFVVAILPGVVVYFLTRKHSDG